MVQFARDRSREEHDFWERQFDRPDASGDRGAPSGPARSGGPPRSSRRELHRPSLLTAEPGWRRAVEWIRDRRGDPRLGVVVLVLIAVVAGFVWYRVGLGGGAAGAAPPARVDVRASGAANGSVTSSAEGPRSASTDAAHTSTTTAATARLVVHVAGAVVRPGVVELPGNARVIDAVEAVGGATADGDLDRLNLAAPLTDGARVYVARRGEADPGVLGSAAPGSTSTGSGATSTPSPTARVNLNTASQEQLEALPGIGPTYAQAIIAERTARGGFGSVNELREVRGIGEKRFADLAPLVTV